MRCVALERRDLNLGENGERHERRRGGRHGERAGHCWDPIRLIRQDDTVIVMVGRDELDEVTVIYPMTVGRKPRAQRPEEEQQEAGNRLMGS